MDPSGTTAGGTAAAGMTADAACGALRSVSRKGAAVAGEAEERERAEGAVPWARAGSVVLPIASEAKRATLQDSKLGSRRRFTCIGKCSLKWKDCAFQPMGGRPPRTFASRCVGYILARCVTHNLGNYPQKTAAIRGFTWANA